MSDASEIPADESERSDVCFQHIVANAPGAIYQCVLNSSGDIEFPFVSKGCRELFGLDPKYVQQDSSRFLDMIHLEDRAVFEQSLLESARTLAPWKWEGRFIVASGDMCWVEGTSRPERQPNGDTLWDGIFMDITERKAAQDYKDNELLESNMFLHQQIRQRQQSERRLDVQYLVDKILAESSNLEDAMPGILKAIGEGLQWKWSGLWTLDHNLNTFFCRCAWHSLDYPAAEFEKHRLNVPCQPGSNLLSEVWTNGHAAWLADGLDDVLAVGVFRDVDQAYNGFPGAFAFPVQGEQELYGVVELIHHQIVEPDEELVLMVESIGKQIGNFIERKGADAALLNEQVFLNALLNNLEEGIVACDSNGVLSLFNATAREWVGQEEAIPVEDWANYYKVFWSDGKTRMGMTDLPLYRAFAGETVSDIEFIVEHTDGRQYTLLASGQAISDELGNKLGAVIAMRDITERKRLQAQIIQSEKLAALGELVAGVAHEINNPLAAILANAELLELHGEEQVREDAGVIRRMSERATRIVRSLLTFAHVDEGQRRPCLLNSVVASTLEMSGYKLRKAKIELALQFHDLPLSVCINESQIQQVLINLLNNAEHALGPQAGPGRRITISTSCLIEAGVPYAVVSIDDNGSGIPDEIIGRVFDPFFTTKGIGEGTGLGLSICHGIATAHGGNLTVQSVRSVGSTFTLTLPISAEAIQ